MTQPLDLTGQRFARLLVTRRTGSNSSGRTLWECRCDCGATFTVPGHALCSGNTRSCGCLKSDNTSARMREARTTHGLSKTRSYGIWDRMISRCTDPSNLKFASYGGRGITVCERWLTFENFYQDMGEAPAGKTIDRINNSGNYEPGNCKWSTPKEQANNTRRNRWITCNGETKTLSEWAKLIGIAPKSLSDRLTHQTPEQAITEGKRK